MMTKAAFYVFRFDATTFRSTHRKYDHWRPALEECYGSPCGCEFVMVATASQQLKAMREPDFFLWQTTEIRQDRRQTRLAR